MPPYTVIVVFPPENVETAVMMKYFAVVCVSFTRIPTEYFAVTSDATVNVKVGVSFVANVQVSPEAVHPSAGMALAALI